MTITANDPDILSLIKITDTKGNRVDWQFSAFPDGQVQIKIPDSTFDDYQKIDVKASLPNPIVLDLFMQLIYSAPVNSVVVNYLYGARCDKTESGDYLVCNVASKTLEDIANQTHCYRELLAPHCSSLVDSSLYNTIYTIPDCVNLSDYDCVVFPDESAYKRYADQLNGCAFTICEKHRDQETGNIISHKIPNLPDGVKKIIQIGRAHV